MIEELKPEQKSWFRKHWIISIVLGVIVLGMIGSFFDLEDTEITGEVVSNQLTQSSEEAKICTSDWDCGSWSKCSSSEIQRRTCADNNNCGINSGKPSETQECEYEVSLISKSPDEMLPTPSELPTEYSIGEKEDITKESQIITSKNVREGFDSGKRFDISQYEIGMGGYSVTDYIEITFGIYKFDNQNYASDFQGIIINEIKSEGGYSELSVASDAECFAWKQDYGYSGGRFGESICYRANVVFWTSISIVNSFKQPDSYLNEMTEIVDNKVR